MKQIHLITRKQAKLFDLKHYYTGKLCKNGHDSERQTTNGSCCQCLKKYMKDYFVANKQKMIATANKWIKDNSYHRIYYKNNSTKFMSWQRIRKLAKTNRTPSWLTKSQKRQIQIEHELAAWCTKVTGIKYHVDHIVPLQGKTVSGLHVPWNLQVIPAKDNLIKSNKFSEKEASL